VTLFCELGRVDRRKREGWLRPRIRDLGGFVLSTKPAQYLRFLYCVSESSDQVECPGHIRLIIPGYEENSPV
jgi:hypothetical protein